MTKRTKAPDTRLQELLSQLASLGFPLPGSITTRQMRCGNPRCHCKADPPQLHGPYTYWTRKVGGRTVAQLLTAEQRDRYQAWIDNDHRLRELVKELEALAIHAAQQAEGWRDKPTPRQPRRGRR